MSMAIKHYNINDMYEDSSGDEQSEMSRQKHRKVHQDPSPFLISKPGKLRDNGWDLRGLKDSDAGESERHRGSRRGGSSRFLIRSSDSNALTGSVFGSISADGEDQDGQEFLNDESDSS